MGYLFAILSYAIWGLTPMYWRLFHHLQTTFIVGNRIVWCCLFLVGWLYVSKKNVRDVVSRLSLRSWVYLVMAALCIGSNWFLYVYAVQSEHILDASFGYFINPLMSVFLARVFLKERLNVMQQLAIGCALLGVGYLAFYLHGIPYLSLSLASTFAAYGLFKKLLKLDPVLSNSVEALILFIPGVILISKWAPTSGVSYGDMLGMILGGVVTALPLVLFSKATNLIPYAHLGFLQYISPSLKLLVATLVYGETFDSHHKISFAIIWVGLALFTTDILLKRKSVLSS